MITDNYSAYGFCLNQSVLFRDEFVKIVGFDLSDDSVLITWRYGWEKAIVDDYYTRNKTDIFISRSIIDIHGHYYWVSPKNIKAIKKCIEI